MQLRNQNEELKKRLTRVDEVYRRDVVESADDEGWKKSWKAGEDGSKQCSRAVVKGEGA